MSDKKITESQRLTYWGSASVILAFWTESEVARTTVIFSSVGCFSSRFVKGFFFLIATMASITTKNVDNPFYDYRSLESGFYMTATIAQLFFAACSRSDHMETSLHSTQMQSCEHSRVWRDKNAPCSCCYLTKTAQSICGMCV